MAEEGDAFKPRQLSIFEIGELESFPRDHFARRFLDHPSGSFAGYYRPIKIRIPASSASNPMILFGITKRTINGSPCKISQTASKVIPTDMLSLLLSAHQGQAFNHTMRFPSAAALNHAEVEQMLTTIR
jgi:hypothetical protein